MTDQEMLTRLRQELPRANVSHAFLLAADKVFTICQEAIDRAAPWTPERGHDGRDPEERESDRDRAALARRILRAYADSLGIL